MNMKKTNPIVISDKKMTGAVPIERKVLESLIGKEAIEKGEKRFDIVSVGPWHICKSITGLASSSKFGEYSSKDEITIFGTRTMSKCKESGYEMSGIVSVNGKKHRAFTSSTLFELEDKKLVNVATLFVCDYYKK